MTVNKTSDVSSLDAMDHLMLQRAHDEDIECVVGSDDAARAFRLVAKGWLEYMGMHNGNHVFRMDELSQMWYVDAVLGKSTTGATEVKQMLEEKFLPPSDIDYLTPEMIDALEWLIQMSDPEDNWELGYSLDHTPLYKVGRQLVDLGFINIWSNGNGQMSAQITAQGLDALSRNNARGTKSALAAKLDQRIEPKKWRDTSNGVEHILSPLEFRVLKDAAISGGEVEYIDDPTRSDYGLFSTARGLESRGLLRKSGSVYIDEEDTGETSANVVIWEITDAGYAALEDPNR